MQKWHQFDCIVTSHWTRTPFCKMTTSGDNIKWFNQYDSSTYNLLETAVPMADVSMYTIKHIKRLCLSHVSVKVKSDFFRVIVDYCKAKGNLIGFFIEPITARLLQLIDDEEFDQGKFMTYHLSMPIAIPQQSSPSSKLIGQDIPLTSSLSELSKNVRSRQSQRINVGDPKNIIP